jgi:hypothetical protein
VSKNTASAAEVNSGKGHALEDEILGQAEEALPDWMANYRPELDAETLAGDMRDLVLDILRELREPWHKLSEKQQVYFATFVQDAMRTVVSRAVVLIAAHDFPALAVNLDLARPANRAPIPRAPTPPDKKARRIGKEDGLRGDRDHAAAYPEYGHADYEIGRALGNNERAALLATALELGAVAGKGARAGREQSFQRHNRTCSI